MSVNTKIIKRRLKSVKNTKKITKAMELVSAAKMRRAVEAVHQSRTFAALAWELLVNLSYIRKKVSLPLLAVRPVERLLVVLITSNRGLCGSFNANIIRKTVEQLKNPKNISRHRLHNGQIEPSDAIDVSVIAVGKKGSEMVAKLGYKLLAVFSDLSDTPALANVFAISTMVREMYEQKKCDKVVVAYTDFRSTLNQVAKLRQVLPISPHDLEKMLLETNAAPTTPLHLLGQEGITNEYLFEPGKLEVLEAMLPRLIETQLYQAVLESSASEHSARMMAMRNASDAAEDMMDELNLNFNKARQAGITQEIAEIAGGSAALG